MLNKTGCTHKVERHQATSLLKLEVDTLTITLGWIAVDYFLVSHDGTVGHGDITRDMNASGVADWLEVAKITNSLGFE
ncbi:hypothetical protein ACFP65_10805 [Marinilactibacillus sp. GCM10026970]|uniref:hypothetical protein n=1 Tax=Marinilactibacillus sp. GCM10026970 TaxID=3252642 RepID=UPI0036116F66